MSWATVTVPGNTGTHYYNSTSSLCMDSSLADRIPKIVKHCTDPSIQCVQCKSMRKSKAVHKEASRQEQKLEAYQKECQTKFSKSLEEMLHCWLDYHCAAGQISVEEFGEFVTKEYPGVAYGAVLVLMLASERITISDSQIIAAVMEESQ